MSRNWQDVTAPLPLPRTITNGFNFVDWSRTRLSGLGPKNTQKGWDGGLFGTGNQAYGM